MIIVNGFQPLTIITKCSIFGVAAVLDPPLTFTLVKHLAVAFFLRSRFCGFKFLNFWSDFCVFSVKRSQFQSFRMFGCNIGSVVREANAAYMAFYIPNIQTYILGKFGSKIENCWFKLKLGTVNYWNLLNSTVKFTFLVSIRNTFFGQIDVKNQHCQFKLKFGTQTNSSMQNSMVAFSFSVLDRKYPFRTSLV